MQETFVVEKESGGGDDVEHEKYIIVTAMAIHNAEALKPFHAADPPEFYLETRSTAHATTSTTSSANASRSRWRTQKSKASGYPYRFKARIILQCENADFFRVNITPWYEVSATQMPLDQRFFFEVSPKNLKPLVNYNVFVPLSSQGTKTPSLLFGNDAITEKDIQIPLRFRKETARGPLLMCHVILVDSAYLQQLAIEYDDKIAAIENKYRRDADQHTAVFEASILHARETLRHTVTTMEQEIFQERENHDSQVDEIEQKKTDTRVRGKREAEKISNDSEDDERERLAALVEMKRGIAMEISASKSGADARDAALETQIVASKIRATLEIAAIEANMRSATASCEENEHAQLAKIRGDLELHYESAVTAARDRSTQACEDALQKSMRSWTRRIESAVADVASRETTELDYLRKRHEETVERIHLRGALERAAVEFEMSCMRRLDENTFALECKMDESLNAKSLELGMRQEELAAYKEVSATAGAKMEIVAEKFDGQIEALKLSISELESEIEAVEAQMNAPLTGKVVRFVETVGLECDDNVYDHQFARGEIFETLRRDEFRAIAQQREILSWNTEQQLLADHDLLLKEHREQNDRAAVRMEDESALQRALRRRASVEEETKPAEVRLSGTFAMGASASRNAASPSLKRWNRGDERAGAAVGRSLLETMGGIEAGPYFYGRGGHFLAREKEGGASTRNGEGLS